MRSWLAIALIAALSFPARGEDGGVDVPFADADAGVFQVQWAEQPDGGQLGAGWWLSSSRMLKVGSHVATLENENRALRLEPPSQFRPTLGFWLGLIVGFGTGVVGAVVLVNQIRR